MNLDQTSLSRPKKLGAGKGTSPELLGCGRSADLNLLCLADLLDPRLCVMLKYPILMDSVSGSNSFRSVVGNQGYGSCVLTQFTWILRLDLILYGSCIQTQFSWARHRHPRLMSHVSGFNSLRSNVMTDFY